MRFVPKTHRVQSASTPGLANSPRDCFCVQPIALAASYTFTNISSVHRDRSLVLREGLIFFETNQIVETLKMETDNARKKYMWLKSSFQAWSLLGLVFFTVLFSTLIAIQPVDASSSCTIAQYQYAHAVAVTACHNQHSNLIDFECPDTLDNLPTYFFFECENGYAELDSCSGF